ncbi:hypothetical protein CBR_g50942 [Chara braunii]|uniref:PIH1D1/2/3 CS-like domain-containing protein n=1 Tax=Chara braunii TaxID=69332 RepID=A0A388M802_CHABU|nr:hypothetical protein CBR_g50942 [Chara braunii]|eukprot:GBG90599.1 hypothetical protein CBR_g50942 [Chara braunii]
MEFDLPTIQALEKLFSTEPSEQDEEEESEFAGFLGEKEEERKKKAEERARLREERRKKREKERAEVAKTVEGRDPDDEGLKEPEYEFVYKQAVTAYDAYFGLSEKNPSSLCCEDLVLKVKLPGTSSLSELKLDVEPTYVKLKSPIYRLAIYLPYKVESEKGSAKWDALTSTLYITMPYRRPEPGEEEDGDGS